MRKVLFIAYNHSKNKSIQSSALVRRIDQYHEFFLSSGWAIDYIITENKNRTNIEFGADRVLQIKVQEYLQNKILNKVFMFFVILFFGDIIGFSFYLRRQKISSFVSKDYDLVISFFTPRGTIWLGEYIKSKIKTSWWVDAQDSLDEGLSGLNFNLGISWLRNKLKSADQIIHVSPEWRDLDKERIHKEILVQRHCIPDTPKKSHLLDKFFLSRGNDNVNLIYGGNIHFQAMSPELLTQAMGNKQNTFYYAGSDSVYAELIKLKLKFEELGVLDELSLRSAYQNSDIIIIFAWNNVERQVIPSKFYEACAYEKPILIVGKDSGSFEKLFEEWGHPNVVLETEAQVTLALENYSKGDLKGFFIASNCSNELSTKTQFTDFLNALIDKTV